MNKKPTKSSRAATVRVTAPERRRVDPASFKEGLDRATLRKLAGIRDFAFPFFFTAETLRPTRTVGLGRTNVTLAGCNTFQTDATPAFASFDSSTTTRQPAVQMHFEPSAYGFGANASLFMTFFISIRGGGSAVFSRGGDAQLENPGNIGVSGNARITLAFTATTPLFGLISQVSGSPWEWHSTQVGFLPVLTPL